MSDREWIVPAIVLTCGLALVAILFTPSIAGLATNLVIMPAWMLAATVVGAVYGFVRMALAGVRSPTAEMIRFVREERSRLLPIVLIVGLAGANMTAFLWVKPLLNYLVPFTADPMLARADVLLFFGHDPWRVLGWLDVAGAEFVYHKLWTIMMILTLIVVAQAPASPEKSAVMTSYFVLWSLAGPLIHIALPAAGPLFYERMGFGERFAGVTPGAETRVMADYLWAVYSSGEFGAGSGISAMPSLHVTTAAWIAIAIHVFARGWFWPVAAFSVLLFLLSMGLGWHYAWDGIVGAGAALVSYRVLLDIYRRRSAGVRAPAIA